MPDNEQEWNVEVPRGIVYPSMSLSADGTEKTMHLIATRADLLQLAENILNAAEMQ